MEKRGLAWCNEPPFGRKGNVGCSFLRGILHKSHDHLGWVRWPAGDWGGLLWNGPTIWTTTKRGWHRLASLSFHSLRPSCMEPRLSVDVSQSKWHRYPSSLQPPGSDRYCSNCSWQPFNFKLFQPKDEPMALHGHPWSSMVCFLVRDPASGSSSMDSLGNRFQVAWTASSETNLEGYVW